MAIVVGPTPWQESASIGYRALGSAVAGGNLICVSGGVAWIVAPASTEVSRSWYSRNDAVTLAQANAACGDWFVPTTSQLCNPGRCCAIYWESIVYCTYWTSTEVTASNADTRNMANNQPFGWPKHISSFRVRAFRCVTY